MQINREKIFGLFVFTFFLTIHYALLVYSGSTYLSSVFGLQNIWVVYSVAALIALVFNLSVARILHNYNVMKLTKFILGLAFINMLVLYYAKSGLGVGTTFIIYIVLWEFLILLTSIMVEDLTRDDATGGIRGKFITAQSAGYLLAPFLSSFVIDMFSYKEIFLLSSVFIVFCFIVFNFYVSDLPKIRVVKHDFLSGLGKIIKSKNIRGIILAQIGLSVFYSLMILYMPFKIESVGLSLSTYLGILLPFALVPFLFIPPFLGHHEDEVKDEKEVLMLAYFGLIAIISIFAFVNSVSILTWGLLLFVSRIFASSIEVSVSSYLFKKIDATDTSIISIFASSQTIAMLFFTPIFAILLRYTDLKTLFLSVSFFLCFVLVLVSNIADTKNHERHKEIKEAWRKNWTEIWRRSRRRGI
jgi:MFS family permease